GTAIGVDVRQHHDRALLGEQPRLRLTEAAGGAGHEGNLAVQSISHNSLLIDPAARKICGPDRGTGIAVKRSVLGRARRVEGGGLRSRTAHPPGAQVTKTGLTGLPVAPVTFSGPTVNRPT